jgi:hypothetical protein
LYTAVLAGATASTVTLPNTASNENNHYVGWTLHITSGTGAGQEVQIISYNGESKVAGIQGTFSPTPDPTSVVYMSNKPQGEVTVENNTIIYVPSHYEFTDVYKGANNIDMANDCLKIKLHKQRLWFTIDANQQNLVFSTDIANPYYVPTNAYIPPVTNDGDAINGLYSFNDVLIISKRNTMFALYGNDEDDYDLKTVTAHTGTIQGATMCKAGNYLFYLGSDGKVYAMYDVRTDIKKMMTQSISNTIDIVKPPINIYNDDWADSRAIYYDNHYILALKDKILVYNEGQGWLLWNNINPTAFCVYNNTLLLTNAKRYIYRMSLNRFFAIETLVAEEGQTIFTVRQGYINAIQDDVAIYKNDVLIDKSTIAQISNLAFTLPPCTAGDLVRVEYLSLKSYNDDGDSYLSYWNSFDMDMGYPSKTKQLKNVYVNVIAIDYWRTQLTVNAFIDYYDVTGGVNISNGIALWGVAKFGERFTDKNIVVPKPVPINRRGKIIRFKLSAEGVNQPFKAFTINGDVVIRNK